MILAVVLAVFIAVSGVGLAYAALPPEHVGKGLYITTTTATIPDCDAMVGNTFTSSLAAAGLSVDFALSSTDASDSIKSIARMEIASSSGMTLQIYNFTFTSGGYSAVIPTAVLNEITNNLSNEAFTVTLINHTGSITGDTRNPTNTLAKIVSPSGISNATYSTFSSFPSGVSVIINPGGGADDIQLSHAPDNRIYAGAFTYGQIVANCHAITGIHDKIDPTLPSLGEIASIQGNTITLPEAVCPDNSGKVVGTLDPTIDLDALKDMVGRHTLNYMCDDGANQVSGPGGTLRVLAPLPAALLGTATTPQCASANSNVAGTIVVNSTIEDDNSMSVIIPFNTLVDKEYVTYFEITGDKSGKILRVYDYEIKGGNAVFSVPNADRVTNNLFAKVGAALLNVAAVVSKGVGTIDGSTANMRVITNPAISYLHYLKFDNYPSTTLPTLVNVTKIGASTDGNLLKAGNDAGGGLSTDAFILNALPDATAACSVLKEPGGHPTGYDTITLSEQTQEIGHSLSLTFTDAVASGARCSGDNLDPDKDAIIDPDATAVDRTTLGSQTVTYLCKDNNGNELKDTGTVIVVDRDDPVIDNKMTIEVIHKYGDPYVETPKYTCTDDAGPVTFTNDSATEVKINEIGTYTVTYTCTDGASMTVTATKTVRVTDQTPPVITPQMLDDVTVEYGATYVETDETDTPACMDNVVGGPADLVNDASSIDTTDFMPQMITFTCTDGAVPPLTDTVTRNLQVVDTVIPVLSFTGSPDITIPHGMPFVDPQGAPTCTDNSMRPTTIISNASMIDVNVLTDDIVLEYVCTDASGNVDKEYKDVSVTDQAPPNLQIATTVTSTTTTYHTINTNYTHPLVLNFAYVDFSFRCTDDAFSTSELTTNTEGVAGVDTAEPDEYKIKYTCTDPAGNSRFLVRTVSVADTIPPRVILDTYLGVDASIQNVVIGEPYVDVGATCRDNLLRFDGEDATPSMTETQINPTSARDPLVITYTCNDGTFEVSNTTHTRTVNFIEDNTDPMVDNDSTNSNFVAPDDLYVEAGATCLDEILTTTQKIDDEQSRGPDFDGTADGNKNIDNVVITYDHNYLGAVSRILPEHLGTTTVTYLCEDEYGNSDDDDLVISGTSDAGIAILPKNHTYFDSGLDAGNGDLLLELGETYKEPGAHCIFEYEDGKNATVGGDRVEVSITGVYDVTYTCTDTVDADGGSTRTYTAAPVDRKVEIGEDISREQRPEFYRVEGEKLVDLTYADFSLTIRPGAEFNPYMVNCTTADMSMDIVPKIKATLYTELFDPDAVINNDSPGMPVREFIEDAPAGRYTIHYTCTGDLQRTVLLDLLIITPSSGNSNDWQLNPTFGRSWESNAQIVSGGFSFNGRTFDVTDNYHVASDPTTAAIGETNTVTIKAYSEMRLDTITLSLGVPEISRVSNAESNIHVKVQTNYQSPAEYDIVDIVHEQDEPLVDPDATAVTVEKVACSDVNEIMCHEFTIQFRIMAPLKSDVIAISAMDTDRRVVTTYVNDGVAFTGDSLLPAETATLHFKRGNQHQAEYIHLTQQDRRYNLWSDQHGFVWMKNSYDSWSQLTQAGFERLQDSTVKVMTRTNSNFADLIVHEREKAKLVFDAETLASHVGESFSHNAPVRIDKLSDPVILEKLRIAELAALEYLKSGR